MLLIFIYLN